MQIATTAGRAEQRAVGPRVFVTSAGRVKTAATQVGQTFTVCYVNTYYQRFYLIRFHSYTAFLVQKIFVASKFRYVYFSYA